MLEQRLVQPNPDETYQVAVDDRCLVVSSGSKPDAPRVWLSRSMIRWIAENGEQEIQV